MFDLTTLAVSSGLMGNLNPLGAYAAIFAGLFVFLLIIMLAFYIYSALAWQSIAKKLGYQNAWIAWIPIANYFLLPILAKKDWKWGFIMIIPIIGSFLVIIPIIGMIIYVLAALFVAIMSIIWLWQIYKLRNYPGWLSLLPILGIIPILGILALIAHFIVIGMVAWKDRMPRI